MTGFLTLALGGKSYGLLATNLASSLRSFSPDVPIAVITDSKGVTGIDRTLFSHVIEIPGGKNAFHQKTRLHEFTPFDVTIYVDADSLFIGPVDAIIRDAEQHEFLMMEYRRLKKSDGHLKRPVWVDLEKAWEHFWLDDDALWPEYNSSVFSFHKTSERVMRYMIAVNACYSSPVELREKVRGHWPDEVAFSATSAQWEVFSGIESWQPAYLEWAATNAESVGEVRKKYPLVTMSGIRMPKNNMNALYNGTINALAKAGANVVPWTFNMKS